MESIGSNAFSNHNSSLTFHGIAGTYAESYANDNNITFTTTPLAQTDYGPSDAAFTVQVLSPINTKVAGAMIQVVLPSNGAVLKEVYTDNQGSVQIDGLQKNCMYRFDCIEEHFEYRTIYCSTSGTNAQVTFVPQSAPDAYLILNPEGQAIGADGGNCDIQVTATSAWTAESNAEWLTIDKTSGNPGDIITCTASANEGVYRTGKITFTMDEQTATVFVRQAGQQGDKLGVPTITFPAADQDTVEYGDITVKWETVEGADRYVVSLRDLDTDTLLIYHQAYVNENEATLSTMYFSDGANYRVAVGAVPAGASSTDPSVGWCERLFSVLEYNDDTEVEFTGQVYELYSATDVNTAQVLQRSTGDVTTAGLMTLSSTGTLSTRGKENTTVSIYHLVNVPDTDQQIWEFVKSVRTDSEGTYKISGLGLVKNEKYTFTFESDNCDFMTEMGMLTYTAQPGNNTVSDVYCYDRDVSAEVEAMKKLRGYLIDGRGRGLTAEYFAWENGDKSSIFEAVNKRNEGVVADIDFSWSNEAVSSGNLWTPKISYYRLNAYSFESKGKGEIKQQINYVPFKFGARFNGFMRVQGADNAEMMANYQFRLRGDDGVRLILKLPYERFREEDWSNGASNKVTVDLSKYGFFNGTVFGVTIEYYNKSNGGKANLIFEYSIDNGKNWQTVPGTWLFQGERTVRIFENEEAVQGIDYVKQLAQSNKTLETYGDKLIADMLIECADAAVNGALGTYNLGSTLFRNPSTNEKIATYVGEKIGKKVAKAFYKAVFQKKCGLVDEDEIWEEIGKELEKSFLGDFSTVYNGTQSVIDSIGTAQEFFAIMHSNSATDKDGLELRILQEYKDTINDTFGNYTYNDNRPEVIDGQFETFFELSETKREEFTADVVKMDPNVSTVWQYASESCKLLDRMFGDDANTNRAMLNLMLAENRDTVAKLFEGCIALCGDNLTDAYDKLFTIDGQFKFYGDPEEFENALNAISNKSINTLMARTQGVSLESILYKDLLKMTLDVTVSYYKGLLK